MYIHFKFNFSLLFLLISLQVHLAFSQTAEIYLDTNSCSGSVVKMNKESRIVYLITAGHCIPGIMNESKNQMQLNTHFKNPKKIIVRTTSPNESKTVFIHATGVLFATFHHVDLAIIKIEESVAELIKLGIVPLEAELEEPKEQQSLVLLNSLTGEQSKCQIEKRVDYLDYKKSTSNWSSRLSAECKLAPGWSGAPVIYENSGKIIGIVTGGNDSGSCDDYCERTQFGEPLALKNRSYISNLSFLRSCVLGNGELSLKCLLLVSK